jgi:alkanesulfonate monooxygenase SsuD/methylene tetrahydromethanopterin reductase-like flavin-dependent oxidoreductase (luciferase family)
VTVFGIHTNAQGKSLADLIPVWRHADELGYGWVSMSDHFAGVLGPESNEAIASQTAMAFATKRARCGVLVYSIAFRHPAVLAAAMTAIDYLSNGRAAIGMGAGALPKDYEIYGFPFQSIGHRMDMLEEGVQCVAGLLHDEVVDFEGKYFHIAGARNMPRPVQERLPVLVGTTGERRGLRIAARYADGWNCGNVSLEDYSRKHAILRQYCDEVGRDSSEVACSVNLGFGVGSAAELIPEPARAAALRGSVEQIVDRIGKYVDAGADQVNFHLFNCPWDYDGLASVASKLGLEAD